MILDLDTLQIRPGVTIGDVKHDREALHDAVTTLELEVANIKAQLAGEIVTSGADDPEWRRRAQAALRAKIKGLATVRALLGAMRRQRQAAAVPPQPRPDREKRQQALLDTFRDELGDSEFERVKEIAKERHPELFGAAYWKGAWS